MSTRLARFGLVLAAMTTLSAAPAARAAEVDARVRGQLDLAAAPSNTAVDLNLLNAGGSPFDPWRFRLFVEGKPAEHFEVFTQVHASEATGLLVYGAYATWTPDLERDLHVQAGKIPWPIGTYGPRSYADKNFLVGAPLFASYHTTFPWADPAPDADALLAQAGERTGRPIVYDFCWDFGAVVLGSAKPLEFSLGVVHGTPSGAVAGRDNNDDKSLLGRVGVMPTPGTRFGISGSAGSYLPDAFDPALPAGTSAERYDQVLVMADAEWTYDRFELRGEGMVNRWETPTLGNLTVRGGYVEGRWAFPAGWYLAGRYDVLRFDEIQGSSGPPRPWDDDVTRIEAGVGYRVDRHVVAKAVYQVTTRDSGAGGPAAERKDDLVAAQLTIGF